MTIPFAQAPVSLEWGAGECAGGRSGPREG